MDLPDPESLKKISEEFWQWRLEDVPEFATACNIHMYNDKLESQTVGSFENKLKKCQDFLGKLAKVNLS